MTKPKEVSVYPLKPEQLQIPDANGNYPKIAPTLNTRSRDALAPQIRMQLPKGAYTLPHAP